MKVIKEVLTNLGDQYLPRGKTPTERRVIERLKKLQADNKEPEIAMILPVFGKEKPVSLFVGEDGLSVRIAYPSSFTGERVDDELPRYQLPRVKEILDEREKKDSGTR